MFVEKIDHIGIAVKDARQAHDFLTGVLGATFLMEMEWGDFVFASYGLGSASMLELIHSSSPEHFINRFIDKRGVNVENPMWKEAFIHPRDALGILVQLAEFPEEEWVETWTQSQQGILTNGAEGI